MTTKKILFVCTGNAGRSQIAEMLYARLTAWGNDTLRVEIGPQRARKNAHPPWWTLQERPRVSAHLSESEECVKFSLQDLRVEASKNTGELTFLNGNGKVITRLLSGGVEFLKTSVLGKLTALPEEHFFGFGLQFHSFDQRGKTRIIKTNADPPTDNGMAHAVAPFYISTQGYALLLNSTGYSVFKMADDDPNVCSFEAPERVLDFFIFAGDNPKELLEAYTRLMGRPAVPPKWGLGFWYRMFNQWKGLKMLEIAREFRDRGIPCDVIGLEPTWQTHVYSCSYVWNKDTFPDPKAFMNWMRENGFRVNLWEHAYTHPTSPIHKKLKKAGCVADKEVWAGLVPDFTLPETSEIFERFHNREHIRLGVSGYKLDECDGADYTGGWFFPDDTKFPSGLTGAEMHNLFGFLYQKVFEDLFRKRNRRTYSLVRANFAGGQAYSSCIYSDYYGLDQYIRACCNSGFTGILWCPELREAPTPEEFIRRSQVVFFSPLAMINAWGDGVLPWEKGEEPERIFKQYAQLRMRLQPYIYSQFRKASKSGIPFIRALLVDFPEDRETYAIDDQFMFGDALMVAPVIKGTSRTIFFPRGGWYDFWTGKRFEGGCRKRVKAPLERLPLYVREGSVIPMMEATDFFNQRKISEWDVHLYPGVKPTEWVLYDDDGVSFDYERGVFWEMDLIMEASGGVIRVTLSPPRGKYRTSLATLNLYPHDGSKRNPRQKVDLKTRSSFPQTFSLRGNQPFAVVPAKAWVEL